MVRAAAAHHRGELGEPGRAGRGDRGQGGRLAGVDITRVRAYRSDLSALGRRARQGTLAVVRDLLGEDPGFGDENLRVSVVDVVEGDPRLS